MSLITNLISTKIRVEIVNMLELIKIHRYNIFKIFAFSEH